MSGSLTTANRDFPGLLRAAALLFLPILGGCASGGSNPYTDAANMDGFVLRVESRNVYDVSVYVNPAGKRELIGIVEGNGLEFFDFQYPAGRPLNVEIETRLGERYRLPPFISAGGGRVDLMVNSDLRRSGFISRSPD